LISFGCDIVVGVVMIGDELEVDVAFGE